MHARPVLNTGPPPPPTGWLAKLARSVRDTFPPSPTGSLAGLARPRAGALTGLARRAGEQGGQATVEIVALLPMIAVVLAGAWQAVLAGHAAWAATTAARAAARAHAIGSDPTRAARIHVPSSLERGLR